MFPSFSTPIWCKKFNYFISSSNDPIKMTSKIILINTKTNQIDHVIADSPLCHFYFILDQKEQFFAYSSSNSNVVIVNLLPIFLSLLLPSRIPFNNINNNNNNENIINNIDTNENNNNNINKNIDNNCNNNENDMSNNDDNNDDNNNDNNDNDNDNESDVNMDDNDSENILVNNKNENLNNNLNNNKEIEIDFEKLKINDNNKNNKNEKSKKVSATIFQRDKNFSSVVLPVASESFFWSPDGDKLLIFSNDQIVYLWTIQTLISSFFFLISRL